MKIQSQWLDQIPYKEALLLQDEIALNVSQSGDGALLGMEHLPVLTLGVRGREEKDILISNDIDVVSIKRGGEATIHNPGQLVIYPIIPLRQWSFGVREFVEKLMRTTELFLEKYNVQVFRKGEPGLYTKQGKIAFFGIQVSRGISRHGLAINISNDLDVFKNISVCGVSGESLDCLANHSDSLNLETLFQEWCEIFKSSGNK